MEFTVLSHAGLQVRACGVELLSDPWLTGSAYWRSWWNYPPVPKPLIASLRPDYIYLTHLHWDHFQADSLRLFDPAVPIIVPYDRYGRMVRDLRSIGRENIIELRHGELHELAHGFTVRSFHFGPFITDSALVVEAEGRVLLNANDAKFAGAPLEQILAHYPNIDFAFRSHSSANPRACFSYLDAPDRETDDNEHYLRSFFLFMQRVKPKFAIPFASNSCLLNDDVFHFNDAAQTPQSARDYFQDRAAQTGLETGLRIMIPGDRWSEDGGFILQDHDWFENRPAHLAAYRERVAPALKQQAAREAKVRVSVKAMRKFFESLARDIPFFLTRSLRGRPVLFQAHSGDAVQGFAVDLATGATEEVAPSQFANYSMRIDIPALILMQAVTMNMFGHAAISKRLRFHATSADMPRLQRFLTLLEWKEAEIFPLSGHFSRRAWRALVPRWREAMLYAKVVVQRLRGRDFIQIEERLLTG